MNVIKGAALYPLLIFHDYFEALEGGGRLCSILAQALQADVGYGFARTGHPFVTPLTTRKRDLRAFSRIPLWRQWKLARHCEFRAHFVRDYRSVVYSGFYTPLAIGLRDAGRNILYCHTPPRFIYDQRAFYQAQLPPILRPMLAAFAQDLQPRYEQAVQAMDRIIANSRNIQQRILHYLHLPSEVIYPPCDTQQYAWLGDQGYFLSTARLDPLKRVDHIVRAFLTLPDQQLVVTSGGPQAKILRKLAQNAPNIHFTGWVQERQLRDLIGHARATIYLPKDEDFGMSPVESMAAGKPVIGVNEGGIPESVMDGETGILLQAPCTPAQIAAAVRMFSAQKAAQMRRACEQRAHAFRRERFVAAMYDAL